MAKSKPKPAIEPATEPQTYTDHDNKAVVDILVDPKPSQDLAFRIAAMLGMGMDVVRERIAGQDPAPLLAAVESKDHAQLAFLLTAPSAPSPS